MKSKLAYIDLESWDESLSFVLPGQSEPYDDCGKAVYIGHVPDPGKIHFVKRKKSCHRFECRECWHDWQKREALASFDRLLYYHVTFHRQIVHYVVSPPQSLDPDNVPQYRALRTQAYRVAKLRGVKGGWMVFHSRACRYSDPGHYQDEHQGSKGYHFHILGDGWLSERVKEFFLRDGWIVKNLRIRNEKGIYNTAFYILDHAVKAMPSGYPAISQSTVPRLATSTWFGTMSYNKLKIQKFKGSDVIYCPVCKTEIDHNDWYVLQWISWGDPPGDPYGVLDQSKDPVIIDRSLTGWSGFS